MKHQENQTFDVLIIGGGLAGLALAVGLRDARLSVALLEARAPQRPAGWDARIYAISPANRGFLAGIGIWSHLDQQRIQPVQHMAIFGDADGRLNFSAYDSGVDELAWIIEAAQMQCELWESARRQANLQLFCPARPVSLSLAADCARVALDDGREFQAKLVVAADGADSWARQAAGIPVRFKPYEQHGVVANFETTEAHRDTACQWFRDDGILAWLPLPGRRISMVWSTPAEHAARLTSMPLRELADYVGAAGGKRLGPLTALAPATGFPLRLMRAPRTVLSRFALIGDAAHAIHPLSGHGINLGLQDAAMLASVLRERPSHLDCGELSLLRRYERARIADVVALQGITDTLQRLFASPSRLGTRVRNIGMSLTNHVPVLKDTLVRFALAS